MLIDTHCHLFKEDYSDIAGVIKKMPGIMVVSGVDLKSNEEMLSLSKQYDNIYVTLGIHPEYASDIIY